jgi:hypothetical protein
MALRAVAAALVVAAIVAHTPCACTVSEVLVSRTAAAPMHAALAVVALDAAARIARGHERWRALAALVVGIAAVVATPIPCVVRRCERRHARRMAVHFAAAALAYVALVLALAGRARRAALVLLALTPALCAAGIVLPSRAAYALGVACQWALSATYLAVA